MLRTATVCMTALLHLASHNRHGFMQGNGRSFDTRPSISGSSNEIPSTRAQCFRGPTVMGPWRAVRMFRGVQALMGRSRRRNLVAARPAHVDIRQRRRCWRWWWWWWWWWTHTWLLDLSGYIIVMGEGC
ncbi:hypothetical protein CMUS01_08059 [Colletotrichum musicola]|uniref:Uncharacterized protein n=1 Tax=Colletotrichum musicola TaxID=2175873 RepID=A0A8H6KEU5_9PEZI|nr:hypothetical protein CMUS01_08059 [Colletotrichum musicola]